MCSKNHCTFNRIHSNNTKKQDFCILQSAEQNIRVKCDMIQPVKMTISASRTEQNISSFLKSHSEPQLIQNLSYMLFCWASSTYLKRNPNMELLNGQREYKTHFSMQLMRFLFQIEINWKMCFFCCGCVCVHEFMNHAWPHTAASFSIIQSKF